MRRIAGQLLNYILAAVIIITASCTEADLEHRKQQGQVVIVPDWGTRAMPQAMRYYFYPQESSDPPIEQEATAEKYEGYLPVGTYKVIGVNTDTYDVGFNNSNSFEEFEVYAMPQQDNRAQGPIKPPSRVTSVVVRELIVELNQNVEKKAPAIEVSRVLVFTFRFTGSDSFNSLQGTLPGVYPSMWMKDVMPSDLVSMGYTVDFSCPVILGEAEAAVRLFGIHNPQNGSAYDNKMDIKLERSDGQTRQTTVDMNDTFTKIIDHFDGEIPVDNPVHIDIEIQSIGGNISAEVRRWQSGDAIGIV